MLLSAYIFKISDSYFVQSQWNQLNQNRNEKRGFSSETVRDVWEIINWTKMVATKCIGGPGQAVQYNLSEIENRSLKKK